MLLLSATDYAIRLADKAGVLNLTIRPSRLGGSYVAICDDCGVIEVAADLDAATARIAQACGEG
jgi:hypothetical protein